MWNCPHIEKIYRRAVCLSGTIWLDLLCLLYTSVCVLGGVGDQWTIQVQKSCTTHRLCIQESTERIVVNFLFDRGNRGNLVEEMGGIRGSLMWVLDWGEVPWGPM